MKKAFLVKAFILLTGISYCQSDTLIAGPDGSKIYNCKYFRKGFYKNYNEFLNNSPSITYDFTTQLIHRSEFDSTIISAKYFIQDSTESDDGERSAQKTGRIWGFCDGTNIFVRTFTGVYQKSTFCKLDYIGPHPYFTLAHKEIGAIGPPIIAIVTVAVTAAGPDEYDLYFINSKGRPGPATSGQLNNLFEEDPEVRHNFNSEKAITDDVKKEYLIKFNENKIKRLKQ